ncbi:YcaO-like family protein [Amycolatopsis sp. NPDC059090]|uniref:YcaO-like family protein n=1 Tax=unclassified Amycolatopsis TaxID=2618356 RepID=UPI00366C7C96
MKIRESAPKFLGPGVHREIAAEDTLARVAPYLRSAGITRIGNITWLDRVGIPVYNAIVPRSRDLISVYNGKGIRPVDAKTSAVMEAIERFSAWLPRTPAAVASYSDLVRRGRRVMHPSAYNMKLTKHYHDDQPISWLEGFDLIGEEAVLVPMHGAAYIDRYHEVPCYQIVSTNGLASGNTLEEAVLHALCELVERDAMTLAELVTTHLTELLRSDLVTMSTPPAVIEELKSRHAHFDMTALPSKARDLVARFAAADVEVRMADITSDIGIPSVWCATVDRFGMAEGQQGHGGFGTHPDIEVAMVRALTECAQSRCVDIQAMREDISMPDEEVPVHLRHVQRVKTINKAAWWWTPTEFRRNAADLSNFSSDDVATDLRFVLGRLRSSGLEQAIVVDLSPPEIPAKVARVIVPGMESWAVDQSKLGPRGTKVWNETVRKLADPAAVAGANGGA